eukprot:8636782-Alexandrium_andersonii.AAC.1
MVVGRNGSRILNAAMRCDATRSARVRTDGHARAHQRSLAPMHPCTHAPTHASMHPCASAP